jgi:apolipoprotein N-acyltransferase
VNNSGDTAIIDPYGRVLKKLGYMQRDVLVEVLR